MLYLDLCGFQPPSDSELWVQNSWVLKYLQVLSILNRNKVVNCQHEYMWNKILWRHCVTLWWNQIWLNQPHTSPSIHSLPLTPTPIPHQKLIKCSYLSWYYKVSFLISTNCVFGMDKWAQPNANKPKWAQNMQAWVCTKECEWKLNECKTSMDEYEWKSNEWVQMNSRTSTQTCGWISADEYEQAQTKAEQVWLAQLSGANEQGQMGMTAVAPAVATMAGAGAGAGAGVLHVLPLPLPSPSFFYFLFFIFLLFLFLLVVFTLF